MFKTLTDFPPGTIYQLRISLDGELKFLFLSEGLTNIHLDLRVADLYDDARLAFSVILTDDVVQVEASIYESFHVWSMEYRVVQKDGEGILAPWTGEVSKGTGWQCGLV